MRPHVQHGRWGPASWLALLPLCLFMVFGLAACSGGGGGGVSGGAATVRGVVVTFDDGQSAFYSPRDVQDAGLLARWLVLFPVASAHAGVGGVTVRVENTDLLGTTDSEGFFILSGVPPGDQVLTFSRNGTSSSLDVSVPANSSVDLGDVRVSGGRATPGDISVEIFEDNSNNDGSNSGSGNDDGAELEDPSGDNSGPGGSDDGSDIEDHSSSGSDDSQDDGGDNSGPDGGGDDGGDDGGEDS